MNENDDIVQQVGPRLARAWDAAEQAEKAFWRARRRQNSSAIASWVAFTVYSAVIVINIFLMVALGRGNGWLVAMGVGLAVLTIGSTVLATVGITRRVLTARLQREHDAHAEGPLE